MTALTPPLDMATAGGRANDTLLNPIARTYCVIPPRNAGGYGVSEERDIIEHGRPAPARPALLRRRPPARITITVAGAVAAALVAVIVIAATRSGSPSRESISPQGARYGSPAHPCALLTMATVTRYVPGAQPGTQLPSQDQPAQGGAAAWAPGVLSSQLPVQPGGDCLWSSNSASPGSIDVAVGMYNSATGLTGAEQH